MDSGPETLHKMWGVLTSSAVMMLASCQKKVGPLCIHQKTPTNLKFPKASGKKKGGFCIGSSHFTPEIHPAIHINSRNLRLQQQSAGSPVQLEEWGFLVQKWWFSWAALVLLVGKDSVFTRSRSPKKAKGETGTPKETKAKSTPEIEQVGGAKPLIVALWFDEGPEVQFIWVQKKGLLHFFSVVGVGTLTLLLFFLFLLGTKQAKLEALEKLRKLQSVEPKEARAKEWRALYGSQLWILGMSPTVYYINQNYHFKENSRNHSEFMKNMKSDIIMPCRCKCEQNIDVYLESGQFFLNPIGTELWRVMAPSQEQLRPTGCGIGTPTKIQTKWRPAAVSSNIWAMPLRVAVWQHSDVTIDPYHIVAIIRSSWSSCQVAKEVFQFLQKGNLTEICWDGSTWFGIEERYRTILNLNLYIPLKIKN